MKQQLQLSIPAPCGESWEDMTPEAQGRHCQKCDRNILDFTHYSDRQLLDLVQKKNGQLCGRFTANQLNRPLIAPKMIDRTYDLRAVALGLGMLACVPAYSAVNVRSQISLTEIITAEPISSPADSLKPSDDPDFIRLDFVDAENGEFIPFVRVLLLDSIGTILGGAESDFDGKIIIHLTDEIRSKVTDVRIKAQIMGYLDVNENWENFKYHNFGTIALTPDTTQEIMLGIIVVDPIDNFDIHNPRPSTTWRPRRPGSRD